MNYVRSTALLLGCVLALHLTGCDFFGSDDTALVAQTRLFAVQIDGKWGYINAEGRIVIEPVFREAGPFVEGRARAKLNGKRGFINATGEFIREPSFDRTYDFSDGIAAVRQEGRWGYVDRAGSFVIAPQYRKACPFSEGRAFVFVDEQGWSYINPFGEIQRRDDTPELREIEESAFANGRALVKNHENTFGFIDRDGVPVIPPQFSAAKSFSDGVAAVKISDRWGYINTDKEFVINPRFIAAGHFNDGLAPVRENSNAWGYINRDGDLVIAAQFEEARAFSEGRAAVLLNGRWGYIDTDGTWTREPEFADVEDFHLGLGRVRLDIGEAQRFGYVDHTGAYVWYPSD